MSISNPTIKPTDIQALFPQAAPATATKKQLGQSDFLKLMLTQFKNQDPTKPVDSAQYVAQLAQFSQVQGLADLNSAFKTLSDSVTSNQALQASSLLGREVLVPGSIATLAQGGTLSGAVDLPQSSGRVTVNIIDGSGSIVRQINLGAHGSRRLHRTGPKHRWQRRGERIQHIDQRDRAERHDGGRTIGSDPELARPRRHAVQQCTPHRLNTSSGDTHALSDRTFRTQRCRIRPQCDRK
jgi:flagellar hook assembly protein FlgD